MSIQIVSHNVNTVKHDEGMFSRQNIVRVNFDYINLWVCEIELEKETIVKK